MSVDARLVRGIEDKLKELNLSPDEEEKRRKAMYKAFGVEPMGFVTEDIELPEGSILLGYIEGEVKQAKASRGKLWVNGKGFTAISGASIEATGRPKQSGWEFWQMAHIPRKGFMIVSQLRQTEQRKNKKRE